jgi:hypothetical protein
MVNPLVAALGPVGGLAACACCLIIAAIWGLFATTIALAVYTSKQLRVFILNKSFLFLNLYRTMEKCHKTGERLINYQWSCRNVDESCSSHWNFMRIWFCRTSAINTLCLIN